MWTVPELRIISLYVSSCRCWLDNKLLSITTRHLRLRCPRPKGLQQQAAFPPKLKCSRETHPAGDNTATLNCHPLYIRTTTGNAVAEGTTVLCAQIHFVSAKFAPRTSLSQLLKADSSRRTFKINGLCGRDGRGLERGLSLVEFEDWQRS